MNKIIIKQNGQMSSRKTFSSREDAVNYLVKHYPRVKFSYSAAVDAVILRHKTTEIICKLSQEVA